MYIYAQEGARRDEEEPGQWQYTTHWLKDNHTMNLLREVHGLFILLF